MLIKKNKKCSQSLALFSIAIPFLKMWKQLVYAWNMNISQFQFSLAPWQIGSSGGHEGHFSRDPLPVFSAGCPCEQFWHGPGCSLFEAVHPVFPLPTTESPTHTGTLKDGFGKAVMACDMPEPWKILPLDRCQKEVPVNPQGSWSCSAPSRWSCVPSRRCIFKNIDHTHSNQWICRQVSSLIDKWLLRRVTKRWTEVHFLPWNNP